MRTLSATGILDELKERTRPHHEAVEARVGVMDPGLTVDGYRRLLGRFRGFYAPVERRLEAVGAWEVLGLDAAPRWKTPRLERDLIALGMDDRARASLPICAEIPRLDSIPRALGCLYVLEGATLGGALIARHLDRHLGICAGSGGAFFASYGEERGAMWKVFRAALVAYEERCGGGETIVDGACDTFNRLDHWLSISPT